MINEKSPVDRAVLNNAIWCGIVCDTHGIPHVSTRDAWGTRGQAPLYYPDIVTLSRDATAEEIHRFAEGRAISSIKDSYANLDLEAYGYRVLFEAEWIWHEPVPFAEPLSASWRRVATPEVLSRWNASNGTDTIIRPELLGRDDLNLFIRENDGGRSGFIASLGGGAVGVSNVFGEDTLDESLWAEITALASMEYPGLPIVGYERGEDLKAALGAGWTSVGPLRVWVRQVEQ